VLRALVDGIPLGEALAAAGGSATSARQQARMIGWFRGRIAEGLF